MRLSIIIPVYNEEKQIVNTLQELENVGLEEHVNEIDYTIVDDCSTDSTLEKIQSYIQSKPGFVCVSHEKNQGKGAAVRTGIAHSKGDFILIQDADMELIPSDIPEMLRILKKYDIEFVNGSRYMTGIIRPLHSYRRYFFNKSFTKIASILINVRLTDLACGYKLFSRNIYDQINLKENRFGFEAELLIKVARLKRTLIAEVPVHYYPRNIGEGKKIRNIDGFRIFWTIIKYGLFRFK